jgi:hypothetical protein
MVKPYRKNFMKKNLTENPHDNFDWKSLLTLMALAASVGAGTS